MAMSQYMPRKREEEALAPWNNTVREKKTLGEFRSDCDRNGFTRIGVDMNNANMTAAKLASLRNKIKKLDDESNVMIPNTERRDTSRRPYFKYISYSNDGKTQESHNGGFYMYTTWKDTGEGKIPVYFRGKNPHNKENFSVQWNKVVEFWYKFSDPKEYRTIKLQGKNGMNDVVVRYSQSTRDFINDA